MQSEVLVCRKESRIVVSDFDFFSFNYLCISNSRTFYYFNLFPASCELIFELKSKQSKVSLGKVNQEFSCPN